MITSLPDLSLLLISFNEGHRRCGDIIIPFIILRNQLNISIKSSTHQDKGNEHDNMNTNVQNKDRIQLIKVFAFWEL